MAGTGRQFFTESEKMILQELIVKYKLNSVATSTGSPALKRAAWARLTEEFNTIETNSKRTEAQLKKCWENLKTRRKDSLAHEKRERMRTGGGSFNPDLPSTSSQHQVLLEDALAEQTDVELRDVIDSDNIPIADVQVNSWDPDTPQVLFAASESRTQGNEPATERDHNITTPRFSETRLTDYGVAPSQGSRNIRTRVIQEEFSIRQQSYDKSQKREEELHKLRIAEKEWTVKAAEQNFLKAKAEREAMEELLRCNKGKREEAELRLAIFRNKN